MSSRQEISAGAAFLRLFLKDDMTGELKKVLGSVGAQLKATGAEVAKIGAGISAAGAAILAPLAGAVKHFVTVSDDLADMSARTGVAASALAELGYAATLSGTEIGAVETAILKMRRTLGDATSSKAARKSFEDLGLSVEALRQLKPEDQFQAIADKLAELRDPLSAAAKLFGKGSAEILPMIANLRSLREEARREGLIPSEEAVAAGAEIKDSFAKLTAVVGSLAYEIGASLAEPVLAFVEFSRAAIKAVRDWVKQNAGLVKIVAAVGIGLTVLGGIVTAVGGTMVAAGVALLAIKAAIAGVAAAVAFLATPVGMVLIAITAVTAALAAGVVWWAKFTEAGKASCKAIIAGLGGVSSAIKALTTGTWQQFVAEVAMAALQLQQIWADTVFYIEDAWQNAMEGLKEAFFSLVDEIKDAWNTLFPGNPITIGGNLQSRKAASAKRKQGRDDRKKEDDAERAATRRKLGILIGLSKPREPGLGGGQPPGVGLPRFNALVDNRKNVITTSAAAGVAAGYQGSVRTIFPDNPQWKVENEILKAMKEAEKGRDKMQRTLDRIAEGLRYG